jgi:hypothetical protein
MAHQNNIVRTGFNPTHNNDIPKPNSFNIHPTIDKKIIKAITTNINVNSSIIVLPFNYIFILIHSTLSVFNCITQTF